MALVGVHIAFGSAVGLQNGLFGQSTLPYLCTTSETMSSGGTSTVSCPGTYEQGVLSISASAPIYYSTGPNPDINGLEVRYMDPQFGREDIIVNSGDFFAWEFA